MVVLAFELGESFEFLRLVNVSNLDSSVHEMFTLQNWTSISSKKSPLLSRAEGNPIMARRIENEINHHEIGGPPGVFPIAMRGEL